MTSSNESQDSEVLVEAIEKILRQITRMVVGRLGFPKYLSLMRKIFVEEAEKILEEKGEKVSMTDLGLLTGIDTRTLAKIRKSENYQKPITASETFFSELTPEVAIVDLWTSDPNYVDPNNNKPIPLQIWGEGKTFQSLVQSTIRSRGITVQSILNRLSQTNSITYSNDNKKVTLHPEIWFAYHKTDARGAIQSGLLAVCKHLDTVHNNIRSVSEPVRPLFERIFWTTRIDPSRLEEFRESMEEALEKSCGLTYKALGPFDNNFQQKDTLVGGVGFYYFDSESS